MIIVIVLLSLALLLMGLLSLKKNNPYIEQLSPYLAKELTLEESLEFLDCTRQFSFYLVNLNQKKKLSSQSKELINELLGLILKIPPFTQDQDVEQIIKNISIVTESTQEIKAFLSKNLQNLNKNL